MHCNIFSSSLATLGEDIAPCVIRVRMCGLITSCRFFSMALANLHDPCRGHYCRLQSIARVMRPSQRWVALPFHHVCQPWHARCFFRVVGSAVQRLCSGRTLCIIGLSRPGAVLAANVVVRAHALLPDPKLRWIICS